MKSRDEAVAAGRITELLSEKIYQGLAKVAKTRWTSLTQTLTN